MRLLGTGYGSLLPVAAMLLIGSIVVVYPL